MKHKPAPQEQDQLQKTVDGPGSQLRKARERQGLDQAKIAAQLHLNPSMIQALEWDDYEKLPAAVFVQGYLKNYARLLGVDETMVINAYQDLRPDTEQQPLPRNQPDQVARELHNDNRLVRYAIWVVLFVMAVLVVFWWQGRIEPEETPSVSDELYESTEPAFINDQPERTMPPREEILPPIAGETEVDQGTVEVSTSDMGSVTIQAEPVPVSQPDVADTVEPVSEEFLSQEPVTPPIVATPPAEPLPEETADIPQVVEPTPAPSEVASGLVVFEFSGPCWVEVRDPSGRARIVGMMQEGMRRSLAARLGPFQVVIGDINVARLTVNGEEYDLGRHTRDKVARFTLDPSRL
jgi:cytoskeleton protein RodZ